jgi:hypothetical protein
MSYPDVQTALNSLLAEWLMGEINIIISVSYDIYNHLTSLLINQLTNQLYRVRW